MAAPAHDPAEAVCVADEALLAAASAGDDAQARCRHLRCAYCFAGTQSGRQWRKWNHVVPWQVHGALAAGADAAYQESTYGRSALMAAAEAGHEQVRGRNLSFVSTLSSWPSCGEHRQNRLLAACHARRRLTISTVHRCGTTSQS